MEISMTIHDATRNELAKILDYIKTLDMPTKGIGGYADDTAMWTTEEIQDAWGLLTSQCQNILRKCCEWPGEVPAKELVAAVGVNERGFGGSLSSVGAMMRKRPFKELGWPLRRMRNSEGIAVYRMRGEWRDFISNLNA